MSEPAPPSGDASHHSGDTSLDALRSATDTTSLSSFERTSPIAFSEEIARANQQLKERIANDVMRFMGISLGVTLCLTLALAGIDGWFIHQGTIAPAERLVTENVVMAVIGATVFQVGAASIAIVYSLFGKPAPDLADSGSE